MYDKSLNNIYENEKLCTIDCGYIPNYESLLRGAEFTINLTELIKDIYAETTEENIRVYIEDQMQMIYGSGYNIKTMLTHRIERA